MTSARSEERQKRLHVIFVESQTGFPYGAAAASRLRLLTRALVEAGANASVLLLKPSEGPSDVINSESAGCYAGVQYRYTAGATRRADSFLGRRLQALAAAVNAGAYLWRCRKARGKESVAVYLATDTPSWSFLATCAAKLLGFPVLVELCEWKPAIFPGSAKELACQKLRLRWADGVFAISDYLEARVADLRKGRPYPRVLHVPILVDCREWLPHKRGGEPYALWCGQIDAYRESLLWLMEAFTWGTRAFPEAHLVVAGRCGDGERAAILEAAARMGLDRRRINITGYVPHSRLAELYSNAAALLAPLEDDDRSRARFPTKIGEYLASGRPVITSAVGEIPKYFRHGETALISAAGDQADFAANIGLVFERPDIADRIGAAGRELAGTQFHYSRHGLRMLSFIESLVWPAARQIVQTGGMHKAQAK